MIVKFPGPTILDLSAETVLDAAKDAGVEPVVVIGFKDGRLYFASTTGNFETVLMLLALAHSETVRMLEVHHRVPD